MIITIDTNKEINALQSKGMNPDLAEEVVTLVKKSNLSAFDVATKDLDTNITYCE